MVESAKRIVMTLKRGKRIAVIEMAASIIRLDSRGPAKQPLGFLIVAELSFENSKH